MNDDVVLSLDGVVKRFGDNEVLRGVSLQLHRHEVVCLIGASGSGKSTLLRCANMLESIDGEFTPNDEVDELVWLPLEHVRSHLTWDRDQELFDLVVQLPELRAQAS